MNRSVRILSIDGGGIRGILPSIVLDYLEEVSGHPVADMFDLLAGTSTGAIICAVLAMPDPPPASVLKELYLSRGPTIFHGSRFRHITSTLSGPRYDARPFETVMASHFGNSLLSDCAVNLMTPCYDIHRRSPVILKSWRAAESDDHDYPVRSVLRAATAAPPYFSPAFVHSTSGVPLAAIDGALFANNPAMCALAEARVLYPGATDITLVSLGVGDFRRPIHHRSAASWGAVSWAAPVIECAMDGASDTVHYQLSKCFGPDIRYHRLQVSLQGDDGPSESLDDASPQNLGRLVRRAERMVSENASVLDFLAETLPFFARERLSV